MINKDITEVEEVILGALMLEAKVYYEVNTLFSSEIFADPFNRLVAQVIDELGSSGSKIDLITVLTKVNTTENLPGYLDQGVNAGYKLSQMTNRVASSANLSDHLLICRQNFIKRQQTDYFRIGAHRAADPSIDPLELNKWIGQKSMELSGMENIKSKKTNKEVLVEMGYAMENAKKGVPTGVKTGLKDVDKLTGGRQNSDLIILAARPGMGKTAMALCQAYYQVFFLEKYIAFFSIEMSHMQLLQRMAAMDMEVSAQRMRRGDLNDDEWKRWIGTSGKLNNDYLQIYDQHDHLSEICVEARSLKAQGKLDIIYIDYLQLVVTNINKKGNNREQEVGLISRTLKKLAKELNIPIVALAQLSRAVEKRPDKKPLLSDLRESGSVEQDADVVEMLFRPEYYGFDDFNGMQTKGLGFSLIVKNRSGSTGDIELRWVANTTQYLDKLTISDQQIF